MVALTQGVTSLWALLAPRHFYHSYPSSEVPWLPPLGPYNAHLVHDFGAASLGLVAVLVAAIIRTTPLMVRVATGAFCVWSIPHLAYHLGHFGVLPPVEQLKNVIALGLAVLLPVALFAGAWTLKNEGEDHE